MSSSFLSCGAVLLSVREEEKAHGFFQESALSVTQAVRSCGGARAGGRMAQEDPESRQLPFHKHAVVSESEQTPPACVLTPSLFGWRRKRNGLLHKRIAYLLFLLQEENKCLSCFDFLVVPLVAVSGEGSL